MDSSDDAPSTDSDDSDGPRCEGAVLDYEGVCFYPVSVEAMGHDHPLDLDGEPGDELVGVADGKVAVHKWNGAGFSLVGEAELPGEVGSSINASVIAGEFDDEPGLDLIVAEPGAWGALYHLSESGAPEFVATTPLAGGFGLLRPASVGPDGTGKWRIVAHYDNGEEYVDSQPLALWEVQGSTLVNERLDLPTGACSFQACAAGDLNGDGTQDAVCTLQDVCPSDPPEEDVVHVVLLSQTDGSAEVAAYPTKEISTSFIAADLDRDGYTDILGWTAGWYRLAESGGGLGPVVEIAKPAAVGTSWSVASVVEFNGTAAAVVLGDQEHGLVLPDPVTLPQNHDLFQLASDHLAFKNTGVRGILDVNGDGVADLPMRQPVILVSEVTP